MDVRLEAFKAIHKDTLAELKRSYAMAWTHWKNSRHSNTDLSRWADVRDKIDALGWVGARVLMSDWDEELGHIRQNWADESWYERVKRHEAGEE